MDLSTDIVRIEKDFYGYNERLVGTPSYIDINDLSGDLDTVIETLQKMREVLKSKTGLSKINIVIDTVPVDYSDGECTTEIYFAPGN